ncbi:hypothetical protein A3I56_04540 [Candidatus Roizmanbacteria bacterium RIFCSPLOWO2_02_FULL_43_10]|uniref:ChrB C-terminal domain-containing protein n=2 Tax=Candidatus Roizmaniibacteriota TaxID=1752723 RepID=A0A1F7JTG2_9BACT|nr:MAG: hypothetical protein A3D08_03175 [Candidatus Roizmanbacteria bacterium RIFCSPHIGHO2_02_FULL_43_11]OGK58889.1 MAG: hypothetical protein A3I56_04540 [Candidatus Roizmanbacteria bacterium RIFCSPLOWO2_02_FULL_43_10]
MAIRAGVLNQLYFFLLFLVMARKIIITHQSPDLDALTSVWLIRRYRRGWKEAEITFVPSGSTLTGADPDIDSHIMHVDTGFGLFDHHQTAEFTCASQKVLQFLLQKHLIREQEIEALQRIVHVVNRYDHFKEALVSNADDDINAFSLNYIIGGLRIDQDHVNELVIMVEKALDGLLFFMKSKVNAEKAIEGGSVIHTWWGKTLVLETDNDTTMKLAFMKGFDMVIRFSPHYRNVSIKTHPRSRKTLKKLHQAIVKQDQYAQWFYHVSGRMLLNASTSATKDMVTKFNLGELVKIVQSI